MSRAFTLALALCFVALALPGAAFAQNDARRARFYLLAGARYSEFAHKEVRVAGRDFKLNRSGEDGGHIAVGYAPSPSWAFEGRVHYGEGDYSVLVTDLCRFDSEFRSNGVEVNAFWYPLSDERTRLRPFLGAGLSHLELDVLTATTRCAANPQTLSIDDLVYKESYNYGLLHTGFEYYFTRNFASVLGFSYHFSRDDDIPDFWSARVDLKYPF